jgi:CRP-like cAMP-binding protein
MTSVVEKLLTITAFRRLPFETLHQIAPLWHTREIAPGETLWVQGEPGGELALVGSGELSVIVNGQEIGMVREGEMIGEATAFSPKAVRSASLKAQVPTNVVTLGTDHLDSIRANQNELYAMLLDQALQSLVRRIRATDLRVAMLSKGVLDEKPVSESKGITRIWQGIKKRLPGRPAPVLLPLLWLQPNLTSREAGVYDGLQAAFVPEAISEGQVLFNEGEEGQSGYLLAEGVVDVVRNVRGRRADVLVRLKPGDQFGTITLVARGHRTATCVAGSQGWVYRMDSVAYHALDRYTREAWNESMIAVLGMQIRNANILLSRYLAGVHTEGPLAAEDLENLMRAAGCLASHQTM